MDDVKEEVYGDIKEEFKDEFIEVVKKEVYNEIKEEFREEFVENVKEDHINVYLDKASDKNKK